MNRRHRSSDAPTVTKETDTVTAFRPLPTAFPRLALSLALGLVVAGAWASSAAAATGPLLRVDALSDTTAVPGGQLVYVLQVTNVGDAATEGEYRLTGSLPAGMTAVSIAGTGQGGANFECFAGDGTSAVAGAASILCRSTSAMSAYDQNADYAPLRLTVAVDPSATGVLTSSFAVSGGGAAPTSTVDPTRITPSVPSFGIDAFDEQVSDSSGAPYTQAGGHPYARTTSLDFNTITNSNPVIGPLWPVQAIRDAFVELPPGFIGDPTATARCTVGELAGAGAGFGSAPICSPDSQVGTVAVRIFSVLGGRSLNGPVPVFNIVPPHSVSARFGFNLFGTVVTLDAAVRSGSDYGVNVNVRNISEALDVSGSTLTFWGVPADPSHNFERACPGKIAPVLGPNLPATCPSGATPRAFLRNPTSCTPPGVGLQTALHIDSWQHPGALDSEGNPVLSDPAWVSQSFVSHKPLGYPYPPSQWGAPQGTTGCAAVPFTPQIKVQPTNTQADSPTGLAVDLSVPQQALSEPGEISQADLRKAVVTLPAGMSVNPSSADGLGACSSAQIGMKTAVGATPIHFNQADPSCPDSSRIGSVEITTPLLEEPLAGSVYLAKPSDNPFNSLLALYIVAKGPGVILKLPGHIEAGADGQLTASFDEQPQLPFELFHLELKSGPRAPLLNPASCGAKSTEALLTPWSGNPAVNLSDSFQITTGPGGAPCANPFNPKLAAGTLNPLAGSHSPFTLHLSREDGSQRFASLSVSPPPGLVATLKGIPYCPEAALSAAALAAKTGATELATPSCPAASLIGSVDTGAGAGSGPFHVPGKAYLAGPYKGASLSLAAFVPAVAGPFDLGDVLVRSAIRVDPESAQITVASDPLPSVLQGIPLDLRSIDVAIDRPGFTLNPTSCDPMSVNAQITSTQGALANPSNRFQVTSCATLAFKPKLTLSLKGGTRRSDHPALRAVLRARPGDANIARAAVTLPHSEFLAQNHIKTICTRVQYAAGQCPKGSVYGHARAFSPLLDKPLEGPVYLRSSSHALPDLVASLDGQIHIDLDGRIDSFHKGIRNTFDLVPDAPLTKFVLTMQGGSKGLLENSRNLCAQANRATALFDGQNGKTADQRPVVGNSCGGGKSRKGHKKGKAQR